MCFQALARRAVFCRETVDIGWWQRYPAVQRLRLKTMRLQRRVLAASAHADSYAANRCKANFGRVTTLTPPAGTMRKGRAIASASAAQSARIALNSLFRCDIATMLYDLGPMALGQLKVRF